MVFDGYSERARSAIFVARYIAGRCGSNTIDLDHLLAALIHEDQGEIGEVLSDSPELRHVATRPISKPHEPFFPADLASDLLHTIEETLPRGRPLPSSTDIPMSPDLKPALGAAAGFLERVKHTQVEPLHLLAGVLAQGSSRAARILREAGISEGKVLAAIIARYGGAENESPRAQ